MFNTFSSMHTKPEPTPTRRSALRALLAGVLTPIGVATVAMQAVSRVHAPDDNGAAQYFPNYTVLTHEGKKVQFFDDLLKDKIVLINMMYAMCTQNCPPNTANLVELQRRLGERIGREIHMYSLTLKPEADDPAALADYVKRYGIGPGWTFLNAKPAEMEVLRRKLGFYDIDPELDKDLSRHAGSVRIGNVRLNRWSMVPAQSSIEQIISSINGII